MKFKTFIHYTKYKHQLDSKCIIFKKKTSMSKWFKMWTYNKNQIFLVEQNFGKSLSQNIFYRLIGFCWNFLLGKLFGFFKYIFILCLNFLEKDHRKFKLFVIFLQLKSKIIRRHQIFKNFFIFFYKKTLQNQVAKLQISI